MAVVRALRSRLADVEVAWVGGHRGLESSVIPPTGIELDRLWLRSLRTVELSVATVVDPLRLGASFSQATAILVRRRPDAVFTTGGYVAIPVLTAAAALRVPSLLWEGNTVPGRSVRASARFASAISVAFGDTCRVLPNPCFWTGTPIRELPADRGAARVRLGLPAEARLLLIFGGSQAVRRFNDAVGSTLDRLVERYHVLHVAGETAYGEALRRREALPAAVRDRYRPFPFLRDEMADALVAADLVIGRAGSSTLAECTAAGVPIVVVPYPHAGAHQAANARMLADAGAAELIADEDFDGEALLAAAQLMEDPERHARMAAASATLGRSGAAEANAELLFALVQRRRLPTGEAIERIARGAVVAQDAGDDRAVRPSVPGAEDPAVPGPAAA